MWPRGAERVEGEENPRPSGPRYFHSLGAYSSSKAQGEGVIKLGRENLQNSTNHPIYCTVAMPIHLEFHQVPSGELTTTGMNSPSREYKTSLGVLLNLNGRKKKFACLYMLQRRFYNSLYILFKNFKPPLAKSPPIQRQHVTFLNSQIFFKSVN